MVSVPQLILAGTLLIFLVAVGVFIAALVRSRRERARFTYVPASVPGAPRAVGTQSPPSDMSLDGLDVGIAEDSPSASLLTPLRTGEWMPPEEPAPLESLDEVSLAGRVAEYTPAPAVPEPPFAVEQYPSWQVGPGDPGSAGEVVWPLAPEAAPEVVPAPDIEPAPVLAPGPVPEVPEDTGATDEFSAEIAALLPQPEPEPEPQPEPEPEPVPVPVLAPEQKPESVLPPEPESIPVAVPVPAPTPAPEPSPAPAPAELADDAFWGAILAEQTRPAARAAAPAPTAPRPTVRVAEPPPPPVAAAEPAAAPAAAPRTRPQARVHLAEAEQAGAVPEAGSRHIASAVPVGVPGAPDRSAVDAQLTMAAPIEVWFGDSRIGVKAGTATYDRFRKYADALLADLHSSGASGGAPR